jgi:pyrroline-5-carboxylate reductase
MIDKKIGFIGAGNMAYSLIGGLTNTGIPGSNIWISDHNDQKTSQLEDKFHINTAINNIELVNNVDIVILAVKPQQLAPVCEEISNPVISKSPLLISIAAGVLCQDIEHWLRGNLIGNQSGDKESAIALVRCMPNTPALVQSGATALFANHNVTNEQKTLAESILRAVGLTLWFEDESALHAVTALSGSGPAYIFLVIEALEKAGVVLGLNDKTARILAIQTAFGASKMALESDDDPETLRKKVTSPGGTTEKAIELLQTGELEKLFVQALQGARHRSIELSELLGKNKHS